MCFNINGCHPTILKIKMVQEHKIAVKRMVKTILVRLVPVAIQSTSFIKDGGKGTFHNCYQEAGTNESLNNKESIVWAKSGLTILVTSLELSL